MTKKQKKMLLRIVLAAGMLPVPAVLPVHGVYSFALYLIPYLIVGYDILARAARGLKNRQVLDENFLMVVATFGAFALGLLGDGDFTEAVLVMLLYQLGELFQSCAVGKSRRSIGALMDIRPDYANIERDGALVQVAPEEVPVGTVIVVQPGEKIPIDGVIVQGQAALDTASLTGESVPRDVEAGDAVCGGCIDLSGLLKIRTTREFGDSTVAKILELVENAGAHKSGSEKFITRFARVYTPAVCIAALVLALVPPVVAPLFGFAAQWQQWLYRGLTFLVASCPCALVISIPLTFFAGIGGASRAGILVKGADHLEALAQVKTIVFDKTGTLTQGVFRVTQANAVTVTPSRLLELTAYAESASSHPVGAGIRAAYDGTLDRERVCRVQELGGHGVTAVVDGIHVAAGNEKLMAQLGIAPVAAAQEGTVVYVALDGVFAGSIAVSDSLKPAAAQAVHRLRRTAQCVMLTGDREEAAAPVARALGLEQYYCRLLPTDKVEKVEQLLAAQKKGARLAFVGDGINDAPVLTRADIGIAMGGLGADAAIEAADVVLMRDDPMQIDSALRISRKCMRIVYENIVFAIAIKLASLVLVALGLGGMKLAIFADVGVMVLAVLNAVRALRRPREN